MNKYLINGNKTYPGANYLIRNDKRIKLNNTGKILLLKEEDILERHILMAIILYLIDNQHYIK